ncbi:MAG: hypothetical protein LQ342_005670 [Letrouitia transgressa]|nr:MAG: hypothetical protein LQ342_005670 [Letrouitia transgressa]
MADIDLEAEDNQDSTPAPPQPKKVKNDVPPQESIDKFWKTFTAKHPSKPFTVLPDNLYAKRAAIHSSRKAPPSKNAVAPYEQAASSCRAKVEKIVRDCRRLNQKYTDPHFDIEFDFMRWRWFERVEDCLAAIDADYAGLRPMSVKRVEDIFDDPLFYIEGMTASDVRQGRDGDCWFMSSICTLSNKEDLLERVCVARDEKVGVYGFVFHRDGEWISEVIDDKLYLTKEDFEESFWERYDWLQINMPNPEDEYRKVMQTGSKALYFAQCRDQNETWLPLLEKAYAKAHGDYASIEGGWVGEGLEDLTGGVTSELFSTDILDKDKFWTDELMNVNKVFLFGLSQMGGVHGERRGIVEQHAYSIMEAKELDNFRLLKIRNPWGKKEWEGAWSDGSEEWTPDRMRRLNHQFGNDGVFWISYKDLLKNFQHIDRTRLFGSDWSITQKWTSINVPWSVNYLDTHFKISLSKASSVVIVLSQLDDRYFQGLAGQYDFQLQFRLHKDGDDEYLVRSNPSYFMRRSVNAELDLEAGQYSVIIRISATRYKDKSTPEDIIKKTCHSRRDKLLTVGLSYDLAHAKGHFKESELERKERLRKERREKRKQKAKKAFESKRISDKKEKLKTKRLEIKKGEKDKQAGSKDEQNASEKIETTSQVTDNGPTPAKLTVVDNAPDGTKVLEQAVAGKKVKVTLEISDQVNELEKGKQPADEEQKKPEDAKQSPEGESKNEQKQDKEPDTKESRTEATPKENEQESSTSASEVTPSTSAQSSDVPEPSSKPDNQQTPKQDKNTDSSDKTGPDTTLVVPLQKLTLDDISDDGLSWSSDLDAPPDSSSESDSDEPDPAATPADPPPPPPEQTDEFADDPWNAVCVVGLRVYAKGSQAEIEVLRKQDYGEPVENKKLDVDDRALDATKGLQRGTPEEERELEKADTAPAGEEESKQG